MKYGHCVRLLFVAFTFLSVLTVRAGVEYSNLGTDGGFDVAIGSTVGPVFSTNDVPANRFVASFDGELTSVEVALEWPPAVDQVTLSLYSNDPLTNLPSTTLPSVNLGNLALPYMLNGSNGTLLTLTIADSQLISLEAGQVYWLAIGEDGSNSVGWNYANNQAANATAFSNDGGTTFQSGIQSADAFEINSDPVPEPSTVMIITLGTISCLAIGNRSRRKSGSVN
jgi:hypothetical protein